MGGERPLAVHGGLAYTNITDDAGFITAKVTAKLAPLRAPASKSGPTLKLPPI